MDARATIRTFITTNFFFNVDPEAYLDTDSFLERGIIDSIGVLELVDFVGKTFGISIAPDEITPENFDSIDNLCGYIERKNAEAQLAEEQLVKAAA